MLNVRRGFHLLMLVMLVMAFAGMFSPRPTGSFIQDGTGWINPAIGIMTIWIVGAIVLRIIGRASR
jgi:hypothetical protein